MLTISEKAHDNSHVREYLEYYLSFRHPTHFAVLLNGSWGIGKTYLLKKILSERYANKEDEYVYVSLYGLSSIEEIDQALMAAIYPALATKGVKIAGKVVKAALKFRGIESDLSIGDFVSKYKAKLYVFDDLERCELKPINKVLGYINEFVEHDDCKVVIIANEKEIEGGDEYRRRREKLIGKTLEVQSSLEEALSHFISLIDDSSSKDFIRRKIADISGIYALSQLNNLRILQQTIWDFERVFRSIGAMHQSNIDAMTSLLRMFFAISFEAKSGRIAASDISGRMSGIVAAMARLSKKDEKTPLQVSEDRYRGIDLGDTILSDELLVDVIFRGVVNAKEISDSLGRSPYFVSEEDEPAWRTVWHSLDRDEASSNRAVTELERQFAQRDFVIIGEMLHVFGLRLWLSNIGAIDKKKSDVVSECKAYVDDMYANKKLEEYPIDGHADFRLEGYGGLGIQEVDTAEYRELFLYLGDARRRVNLDQYPVRASDLLVEMEQDPSLYFRRLCLTNSADNTYYQIPILAAIDPDSFVEGVLKQSPIHQRTILSAFKGRYERGNLDKELQSEEPWLAQVRVKLMESTSGLSPIAIHRIETLIRWYLDPAIEAFKQKLA